MSKNQPCIFPLNIPQAKSILHGCLLAHGADPKHYDLLCGVDDLPLERYHAGFMDPLSTLLGITEDSVFYQTGLAVPKGSRGLDSAVTTHLIIHIQH